MSGTLAGAAAAEYFRVNDALNRIFFDGRFRLAPVYLDLEDDLIEEAAQILGVDAGYCLEAIGNAAAGTLQWQSGQSPYAWHLNQLAHWDKRSPPPFTAILTALAMAAERMRADARYSEQNYYERLFEVLGVTDETHKNRLKQHASNTKEFWDALSYWLAASDFEYGRPTAKPMNNWEYAGNALSQALVRRADRQRMHACFIEYGLAPHERLTEGEMTQYLHDWMRGPDPSQWLKRIWNKYELRSRVAAAACAELEAWDGEEVRGDDELSKRRLSWAASFKPFPAPTLRMYLSAASDGDAGIGGLALEDDASAAARAAFADAHGDLWLSPSQDGAITILEPLNRIVLSPLMLASFALEAPQENLKFVRTARSIVPLARLDSGAYFREVSRVSFLRPHLILCHQTWRERASALLHATARQGFVEWTAPRLSGLPADWVLFSGVEILRPVETAEPDLAALTPIAEGITIELTGGVRLSQGIYHCRAAPEVTASSPDGALTLRISNADKDTLLEAPPKATSRQLILSSAAPWAPDTFTIDAEAKGRHRSLQITFRSADVARPPASGAQPRAYVLDPAQPGRAISATADDGAASAVSLQGLIVTGEPAFRAAAFDLTPAQEDAEGEDEPAEPEGDYQLQNVAGLEEACLLRGHHYWDVDPVPPGGDPNAPIWMKCRDCKLRILAPGNRGRARGFVPRRGAAAVAPAPRPPGMRPRAAESAAPPDLVYDALCYLGSGAWQRLLDVAADGGADALSYHDWSSNMMALGFIDVTYDAALRSPIGWSVPPPALVFTTITRSFLSGFRSDEMVAAVREQLCSNGAEAEIVARGHAPDAIFFNGVGRARAAELLASIKDGRGRPIRAVSGAALAIAAAHPPLNALTGIMTDVGIDTADNLKRFDPASGRWRAAEDTRTPGAYRADYAGRRYFLVEDDGSMKQGPYWLVKLVAAKRAGLRVHGYDLERGAFQAVLGCGLPPLLERALAASTGLTPHIERGKMIYENVPRELAAQVLSKLYS